MGKRILRERLHTFENGVESWRVSAGLTPQMCWEVFGEGRSKREACENLEDALRGLIAECNEALEELEEYEEEFDD